jgi:hypothetical protein
MPSPSLRLVGPPARRRAVPLFVNWASTAPEVREAVAVILQTINQPQARVSLARTGRRRAHRIHR